MGRGKLTGADSVGMSSTARFFLPEFRLFHKVRNEIITCFGQYWSCFMNIITR